MASEATIDALPYIDKEYDDEGMRQQVDRLVQEEMGRFAPPNYLAERPVREVTFGGSKILQAEFARVAEGRPMQPLDTARYNLEPPSESERDDPEAWRRAVDNAAAQLEHQAQRLVNLELLQQYGPTAWRVLNADLEAMRDRVDRLLAEEREKVSLVNLARKTEQMGKRREIEILEVQWREAVTRNQQIQNACTALEGQVTKLRRLEDGSSEAVPPRR